MSINSEWYLASEGDTIDGHNSHNVATIDDI